MSFGERLLNLLDERNMSQKRLAKELHMAPTTINGYIKEHRQPDYSTLIRIAGHLQVTTDYLLGVSEFRRPEEHVLSVEEENLVGVYRDLQPDKQDLLMEQAEFYRRVRKKEEEGMI